MARPALADSWAFAPRPCRNGTHARSQFGARRDGRELQEIRRMALSAILKSCGRSSAFCRQLQPVRGLPGMTGRTISVRDGTARISGSANIPSGRDPLAEDSEGTFVVRPILRSIGKTSQSQLRWPVYYAINFSSKVLVMCIRSSLHKNISLARSKRSILTSISSSGD